VASNQGVSVGIVVIRSEFLKILYDLSLSAPNMLQVNLSVIVSRDQNCATVANLLILMYSDLLLCLMHSLSMSETCDLKVHSTQNQP